jgi:hypothetical protein
MICNYFKIEISGNDNNKQMGLMWGFPIGEDLDVGLLGCNAVWIQSLKLYSEYSNFFFRMSTTGEIILKTMSDYWVVGKVSNLREFYVVIHQKNANLIEINGKNI